MILSIYIYYFSINGIQYLNLFSVSDESTSLKMHNMVIICVIPIYSRMS